MKTISLGYGAVRLEDGQLRDDLSRLWCACGKPAERIFPNNAGHERFKCYEHSKEEETA